MATISYFQETYRIACPHIWEMKIMTGECESRTAKYVKYSFLIVLMKPTSSVRVTYNLMVNYVSIYSVLPTCVLSVSKGPTHYFHPNNRVESSNESSVLVIYV
jgi:hypothetical protein